MNGVFSVSSLLELLGSVCPLGAMPPTLCVSFFKKNVFFKFLAAPDGIWDLSSQTRDQISTSCSGISLNHQTTSVCCFAEVNSPLPMRSTLALMLMTPHL